MEPRHSYRVLARVDAFVNRIYTAKYNPLYHSGAITVGMLAVLLVTGIYLLLFYRLGAPYDSVERIAQQAWGGSWIRGLHRFASDAAVIAAAIHAFRMYAQRRSWGPRALAWVSGVLLFGIILVSGWTGYILVWDTHAQVLATEGARLVDALPVFSEPISRSFTGDQALPNAFFFVTLFAHIALPLSIGVLLWVHVARVSRPILLPSRPVLWTLIAALTAVAVVWPLPMAPAADLLRIPGEIPVDWFFSFWLPITSALPAPAVWVGGALLLVAALGIPALTRPKPAALPAPATVNERTCTGCEQCVHDCPYDAIEMVARTDGREGFVARVKTELCTSCGVCIGSCPPMAIGPLGLTARDQLAEVRSFLASVQPGPNDVVIVGCAWSAARVAAEQHGAKLLTVPCIGAMHTSTVELLLRGGAGGVIVAGCPEHDGRTREGVTWTDARLFDGRKAELKQRVDTRRVRLVQANISEHAQLHAAVIAFASEIDALHHADGEQVDVIALCKRHEANSPATNGRLMEDRLQNGGASDNASRIPNVAGDVS